MCVFHGMLYTSSLLLWKTGCGVWVWERAVQLVYHVCLSWNDASFCIYFFPFRFWCKAVGSDCNISFWAASSQWYTHGISNKNATRSNCLKITWTMMNLMNDRDDNAFLIQWYFPNRAVCLTWTGLLWINIALLLYKSDAKWALHNVSGVYLF